MFIQQLQDYFLNERIANTVGLFISLILLILWFVFRKKIGYNQWLKGLSYPWRFLIVFGFLLSFNIYNNTKRLADFTTAYWHDPKNLVTAELNRMTNMDSWWLPLNIFWLTLIAIGLAFLLFNKKAFIKGIFSGVIIIGLIGFSTDRYSKTNAAAYKARLQTELLNLNKQHIK